MVELVVPLARALAPARFGGKAAQLGWLMGLGRDVALVPDGFAISVEVFRRTIEAALPPQQWPERLIAGPAHERRGDRLAQIRDRCAHATLDDAAWSQIATAATRLGDRSLAVRSSALHEDTDAASAAGLQDTQLGVLGEEALRTAILACFASIYRERALEYLARARTHEGTIGVALVVQAMVRADTAGVLFTVDPIGPSNGAMVIEAAHGLGSSVVDGSIAPDVYRLDRVTGALRASVIGDKRAAVVLNEAGSLERTTLSPDEARRAALGESQLRALHAVGRAVEDAAGAPRDVEWAFEGEVLYLLQARPIVGLNKPTDDRETWVWSNVNVGEALPGVATPLTWTVAVAFSEVGFRKAFGSLGCVVPPEAELVAQFHGRIYLNLTWFMRIASQVPALDPRLLLEFGGGGGLEVLEGQVTRGSWPRFLLRAPVVGTRFIAENLALDRRLIAFERDFASERQAFERARLGDRTGPELAAWLDRLAVLLDRTGGVMLTCASGSLSSLVALRTLLRTFAREDATRLERELLTGIADLESAAPGIALVHIAEQARREPAALDVLRRHEASRLSLDQLPEGPTRRALEAFLRAYGYRAAREAELSTPRWRESPGILFAMLKAQLERSDASSLARVERQVDARAAAERELDARLAPPARAIARHLLARARKFVRLRERSRARVTEVLGFFRTLAVEASERITRRAPDAPAEAAFLLRVDELRAFLRNEPVDIGPLVTARRADFARDLARPDPPPVFVGSPPPVAAPTVPTGDRLEGIAASRGCVTGLARVLRDPADGASLRPGEVLVAPVADVGWTPLFLAAAAVVTELGGALSHAAVVAREYGLPAVVNVAGATRAISTGDTLRVDGDHGVIEVLARA